MNRANIERQDRGQPVVSEQQPEQANARLLECD